MADLRNSVSVRDSVCVSCNRIMDSCRDKDCFENVRVYLDDDGQQLLEHSGSVRVKCADVAWCRLGVDNVPFNQGFCGVDCTYFLRVNCEFCCGAGRVQEAQGIAAVDKRVILYGGEGNVSTFRSPAEGSSFCTQAPVIPPKDTCCCEGSSSLPTAVCEVAEPVILDVKIMDRCSGTPSGNILSAADIPQEVWNGNSPRNFSDDDRYLALSFGLFSVIRLERPTQIVVNAAEYTVPEKECAEPPENDPCAMFRRMQFPVAEFSTSPGRNQRNCGCGN